MSSVPVASAIPLAPREAALKGGAVAMTLLLPVFLFYGRAVADALLSGVALLFLARSLLAADWRWAWRPWVWLAAALWLLTLAASVRAGSTHSALEALVLARLLLFCAALEAWVLTGPRERRWLGWVVTVLAAWLALECWQQYLFGHNVMGDPRWSDGALTGPFHKPRAGGAFLMVLFPGPVAIVLALIGRNDPRLRLAGLALLLFSVLTMILIGQRMPTLLMLLGLAGTALIVRRFRRLALIALAVAALTLLALPAISPPTYAKLVVKFSQQMAHFASSPYGQLYTRATVITAAHPWLGLGFDGFRDACADPAYFHGLPTLGIPDRDNGGVLGCNIHPHNYYLQVATSAGVPGLLLFVAMVWLWLRRMVRALPSRDGQQAMLLVTAGIILWPAASTSSLFTLDTAGWVFLMTGWALAASGAQAAGVDL